MQNAWNKYWDVSFKFEIIEICAKEILIKREQFWIDWLQCVRPNGYNLAPIAGNSLGIKRSEETREKQRQKKLGIKQSLKHIEARARGMRGHKVSNKVKETIRKRSIGNAYGLGYNHSEETKTIISATHKGKPKSEEHKKKIAETLRNKTPFVMISTPIIVSAK